MRLLTLFFVLLFALPSSAKSPEDFAEKDRQKIFQAQKFFNDTKTISASFMQISPYFTKNSPTAVSHGQLFIKRPGEARWEYERPQKMLLIINDDNLSYYDYELDQVSYKDIEDEVMLSLLTKENIKFFGGELVVTEFSSDEYGFNILTERTDQQSLEANQREQLLLSFLDYPLRLKRLKYRDANGYITTLELDNLATNQPLDDDIFLFKSPRIFDLKND